MKRYSVVMVLVLMTALTGSYALAGGFHGAGGHSGNCTVPSPPEVNITPHVGMHVKNTTVNWTKWLKVKSGDCRLNITGEDEKLLDEYFTLTGDELLLLNKEVFMDSLKLVMLRIEAGAVAPPFLAPNESNVSKKMITQQIRETEMELKRLGMAVSVINEQFSLLSHILYHEDSTALGWKAGAVFNVSVGEIEAEKLRISLELANSNSSDVRVIGEYLAKTTAGTIKLLNVSIDDETMKMITVAEKFNVSKADVEKLVKGCPVLHRWLPPMPLFPGLPVPVPMPSPGFVHIEAHKPVFAVPV